MSVGLAVDYDDLAGVEHTERKAAGAKAAAHDGGKIFEPVAVRSFGRRSQREARYLWRLPEDVTRLAPGFVTRTDPTGYMPL